MKTIGVLGGMGPQATMDLVQRMHAVSQRLIPQKFMMGYPTMVVYYYRFVPMVLNEQFRPVEPEEPEPKMLEAAAKLGPLVDFFVVSSNGPHAFHADLEKAAGKPLLSMIDGTLEDLKRREAKRVGVLGLGDPQVYTKRLDELGIAHEIAPAELRGRLDEKLLGVMEGTITPDGQAIAREAVELLRGKGCEAIILGCTEIPLLMGADAEKDDLINPAALLAEAAVRHAMD